MNEFLIIYALGYFTALAGIAVLIAVIALRELYKQWRGTNV